MRTYGAPAVRRVSHKGGGAVKPQEKHRQQAENNLGLVGRRDIGLFSLAIFIHFNAELSSAVHEQI